jgi:hypothetical protein
MIRNDEELAASRERLARIEQALEALRETARPEEWPDLSSGYRLEIERMQGEILDYLVLPRVGTPLGPISEPEPPCEVVGRGRRVGHPRLPAASPGLGA